MKRFLGTLTLVTLVAVLGCGDKSKPGGPGVKDKDKDGPVVGQKDGTFKLDVPNSVSLKQGETKEYSITIDRGDEFDQDVKIKFENMPAGVTATPADPNLAKSVKEVKFSLTAAADAALGDFTVKVVGTPATGPAATSEMKVGVSKAD